MVDSLPPAALRAQVALACDPLAFVHPSWWPADVGAGGPDAMDRMLRAAVNERLSVQWALPPLPPEALAGPAGALLALDRRAWNRLWSAAGLLLARQTDTPVDGTSPFEADEPVALAAGLEQAGVRFRPARVLATSPAALKAGWQDALVERGMALASATHLALAWRWRLRLPRGAATQPAGSVNPLTRADEALPVRLQLLQGMVQAVLAEAGGWTRYPWL